MDEDIKKVIDILNKISIGCRVFFENKWHTVTNIVPCRWQNDDKCACSTTCIHCKGYVVLDNIDAVQICQCKSVSKSKFEDVALPEFIAEEEMMI